MFSKILSFFRKDKTSQNTISSNTSESITLEKSALNELLNEVKTLKKQVAQTKAPQEKQSDPMVATLLAEIESLKVKVKETESASPSSQAETKIQISTTSQPDKDEEKIDEKDCSNAVSIIQTVEEIPLDRDNQRFMQAVELIENTKNSLFLTGKAGTGKTTFLKYLKTQLKNNFVILAPTGIAAVNAGGQTIHSFFGLSFSPYLPNGKDRRFERFEVALNNRNMYNTPFGISKDKLEIIKALDLLIIDEVSMVRCDIIDTIDQLLRIIRRKRHLPFGGVQMLFIGDLFQLSPIATANDWQILSEFYQNEFFFSAYAFAKQNPNRLKYECIELDKIYRQNDPKFIQLLNNVRENKVSQDDFNLLNSKFTTQVDYSQLEGYITLSSHRRNADMINNSKLARIDSPIYSFKAQITGIFDERDAPADVMFNVKVGSQVMLLKNSTAYYNGSIGIVEKIELKKEVTTEIEDPITKKIKQYTYYDDFITVKLLNNELVTVSRATWENIEYKYNKKELNIEPNVIGKFFQFPMKLAWAITIHKSQGLTFDKAIIDAGAAFAHGQTYVALSRCRSLEGILLRTRIFPKAIITDPNVIQFYQENLMQNISPLKKLVLLANQRTNNPICVDDNIPF